MTNWRGAAARRGQSPASESPRWRRRSPALCLCDVDTVSLVILLHRLQALSGLLEVPFGLAQTTEDASQNTPWPGHGPGGSIRDAQATQPRVGQLDQRRGAVNSWYNT